MPRMDEPMRSLVDLVYSLIALAVTFAATLWAFWHFSRTVLNETLFRNQISSTVSIDVGNVFAGIAAFMACAAIFILVYRRVICRLVP